MDTILDFLANNYLWFLIVAAVLLFALIGYLVDTKKDKTEGTLREKPIKSEAALVEEPSTVEVVEVSLATTNEPQTLETLPLVEKDSSLSTSSAPIVETLATTVEPTLPNDLTNSTTPEVQTPIVNVGVLPTVVAEEKTFEDAFTIDNEAVNTFEAPKQ